MNEKRMCKGRAIQVYKFIRELVLKEPNDQELGRKTREHFLKLNK